ncbi:hypothetical protein [Borrelia sp. HM]|uniref:hypothetical protein n=1 Tax=Borrelia sp. HM TaxID=1882662 RepID=UPI001C8248C5|nr:hypothetical protein [Borrelia sp. HM]
MNELLFYKVRLISIFFLNVIFSIFYLFMYGNVFGIFILFLMLINIFVIISYLRYFYEIDFEENKIFYRKYFPKINFNFNDIVWIEKRLLDNVLILGLNNGLKIKVYFLLRNEYLNDLFRKLKSIRSDLFIVDTQELPRKYYISSIYLMVYLSRILTSIFIYYVSFDSIIIFLFILFIDIKVLIGDILSIKDLVIFYEFREDSVYERKIFSKREYFYKFFNNIFVKNSELNTNGYLSFIYSCNDKQKKVYINDKKMSYSMFKVFNYVNRYCKEYSCS